MLYWHTNAGILSDFVPVSILKRPPNDKIHSASSDRQNARENDKEQDQLRAIEMERERERLRSIEMEKERERLRAIEMEKERERLRAIEIEKEKERLRAVEIEREKERLRTIEMERERERLRALEIEKEMERLQTIEMERERERLRAKEIENEKERLRAIEIEKAKERLRAVEIEKERVREAKQKEPIKSPLATPKVEKERRSFLNLFSKRTTSTECTKKQAPDDANYKKALRDLIDVSKANAKASASDKVQTEQQHPIDDRSVVVDHYGELVRELGGKPRAKATVPLYMNQEALREAAAKAELEEREIARKQQQQSDELLSHSQNALNESEDPMEMLEVARKMNLYTDVSENDNVPTSDNRELVEISVEHTQSVSYAVREIKQPVKALRNDIVVQGNVSNLIETTQVAHDGSDYVAMVPDYHNTTMPSNSANASLKHRSLSRHRSENIERRSKSKSPLTERKTSLTSTVLKVTRRPIAAVRTNNGFEWTNSSPLPSSSPSPSLPSSTPGPSDEPPQCRTPDQLQVEAETYVRSTLNYTTDLAMFLFACWIYIFHDVRYVIPILILMVFRRIQDAIERKLRNWTWK